jgi:hypothetical protein
MSNQSAKSEHKSKPSMSPVAEATWSILAMQFSPSNYIITVPELAFSQWNDEDQAAILYAYRYIRECLL